MPNHTRDALATLLIVDPNKHRNDNYLSMAIVLARSIREIGYDQDIVVITNHEPYKDKLTEEGFIVEHRDFFDYPALYDYKCNAWGLSRFDMQKVYYWSLCQYNRVICLDCDILAGGHNHQTIKFTDWDNQDVLTQQGRGAINSGIMCITPTDEIYTDMRQIIKTAKFSPESGWNECGLIKGVKNWGFQNANAAQGFIPFYFNGDLTMTNWRRYFRHFAGAGKYKQEYTDELKRHGFKLDIPKHILDKYPII